MEFFDLDPYWIHRPAEADIRDGQIRICTEPGTDLWQNTAYGFVHDNAPMLLVNLDSPFTLTVRVQFAYRVRFDQCGIIVHIDSENWLKQAIEYENAEWSQLGSVATNRGYSDWAVSRVPSLVRSAVYRISRNGCDFRLEFSQDGSEFEMMRITHLEAAGGPIACGVYACSPGPSSFEAVFDEIQLTEPVWTKEE